MIQAGDMYDMPEPQAQMLIDGGWAIAVGEVEAAIAEGGTRKAVKQRPKRRKATKHGNHRSNS